MAQLDKTTFEGKYNSGASGLYKDNTTNDIEEVDLRLLVTDVKDSFLNKTDEAYTGVFPQFTTSTSTTAYVGTPSPVITAYATGQKFQVKIHAASTGSATLNLNGLGAKKIFTDPVTQAIASDLVINQIYILFYDAALDSASGGFLMIGGSGSSSTSRRQVVVVGSDVTNTTTSFADATDLEFPVVNAGIYWFKFVVDYTAAATTTGSKWSINGPSASRLNYQEKFVNSSTTESYQPGYTTYDTGVVTGASTTSGLAFIEGFITMSASGNIICRFASEVGGSAITVKSGSFVEFMQLN